MLDQVVGLQPHGFRIAPRTRALNIGLLRRSTMAGCPSSLARKVATSPNLRHWPARQPLSTTWPVASRWSQLGHEPEGHLQLNYYGRGAGAILPRPGSSLLFVSRATMRKARIALARRLAIIMHAMLKHGTEFKPA
jgi:hypothetical protein